MYWIYDNTIYDGSLEFRVDRCPSGFLILI